MRTSLRLYVPGLQRQPGLAKKLIIQFSILEKCLLYTFPAFSLVQRITGKVYDQWFYKNGNVMNSIFPKSNLISREMFVAEHEWQNHGFLETRFTIGVINIHLQSIENKLEA